MKPLNLNKKLLFGLIATTLILAGCTGEDTKPSLEERMSEKQPELEYDLGDVQAEVTQATEEFGFNATQLRSRASSCGNQQELDYFEDLVAEFEGNGAQRFYYNFDYSGESQGSGRYQVFLIENVAEYKDLEAFKQDFDLCGEVGFDFPTLATDEWLLFTPNCRKPLGDSELPDGCSVIKEALEGTFKIK